MEKTVTIKGNPVELAGRQLKIGDRAPDFTAIDKELKEVGLKDFRGKIKLISVAFSLDTPICDTQLRRFNEEAARLPGDVAVINITMDLPFAIERFCSVAGIEKAIALSDHRDASFGTAYGVFIKGLRLLARSIFVVDDEDIVRYVEIVPEVASHPDYEKALDAVRKVLAGKKAAVGA